MSVNQLMWFLLFFTPIVTFLGYTLGRRKTQTPWIMAGIFFITSFVPPVAILLMFILALKGDIPQQDAT